MHACPTCHATYADDLRYCTQDATPLVPAPNPPVEPPRAAAAPAPTRPPAPTTPISTAKPAASVPPRPATAAQPPRPSRSMPPTEPSYRMPRSYRPAPTQPAARPAPTPYPPAGRGRPKFSGVAIWAFVFSLCFFALTPLAIIFGHIARWQARHGTRTGGGLALAALIIGYISLAPCVAFWLGVTGN